jgi:hypothetical protein
MLCVDPTKRIGVAEMKVHPFMSGRTFNDLELADEMGRRKVDIDGTRARQRLEQQQKKRAEDQKRACDGISAGGDLSGEIYRGEGGASPDGEDLPHDAPSMSIAARGGAAIGGLGGHDDLYGSGAGGPPMTWGRYTSSLPGLDNGSLGRLTSSSFGTSYEPSDVPVSITGGDTIGSDSLSSSSTPAVVPVVEKKEAPAAPLYVEDISGAVYTKFTSEQTPSVLLGRLRGILDASGVSLAVQNDKYKVPPYLMIRPSLTGDN